MKLFREWCLNMKFRKGLMIPQESLDKLVKTHPNPGYMSLYAFDEAAAAQVRMEGRSRGFDRFTPYADELIIDIDEGMEGLKRAEEKLTDYEYTVYESGGKGAHIILPHDPIFDKRLPFSHTQTVKRLGVISDPIYNPARLISLPGRVHPTTRRKKRFLRRHEGRKVEIPLLDKPAVAFEFGASEGSLFDALMRMADLTLYSPYCGTRHLTLFGVAMDLKKAGVEFDSAVNMLELINEMWKQPKTKEEVFAAVKGAYSYAR